MKRGYEEEELGHSNYISRTTNPFGLRLGTVSQRCCYYVRGPDIAYMIPRGTLPTESILFYHYDLVCRLRILHRVEG